MAVLRIGPTASSLVDMPSPTTMEFGIQDISKASRNANGLMILERIATKTKIDLSWAYLSAADTKTVLNAVSGTFFAVGYTNPLTNDYTVKTFYAGDRKIPTLDYHNGQYRYKDIAFNIIER